MSSIGLDDEFIKKNPTLMALIIEQEKDLVEKNRLDTIIYERQKQIVFLRENRLNEGV
jgi:hypothetical protein